MNNKVLFNDGWTFAKSGLEAPDSSELNFEPIDIPHDWLIWQTHHLYENSIGWYRKLFPFRAGDETLRYLLYFEGVYMNSSLYVNGRLVGEWKYGYSSFEHDITDALIDGENELIVKVMHQSPNSRWYSGAGIYRNVWLKTRGVSYIATAVRHSFGDARSIRLHADKERMKADGLDVISVEIGMDDEAGHPVENANNRVTVEVSGAGRLIGLDNGDSADYDAYKGTSRRLFSGKLLAIVGATLESGTVQVKMSSKGMESRMIELEAVPLAAGLGAASIGVSASSRNREFACSTGSEDEQPLRKLEIVSEGGQLLNAERREIAVRAVPHPADTTYRDVEWSVVNDAGIVSNIAKVEANGLEARIADLGDGEFRLRCTSRNGMDKTKLISQLEFKAAGLGKAYKNPF